MEKLIGILGAMSQEIDEVIDILEDKESYNYGSRIYYKGKINGTSVVVAFSKWGKVAATITVTTLIEHFHISELIFIGTAGALADDLRVGDVVVANRLIQHDMDVRPILKRFEVPLLDKISLDADKRMSEEAYNAVKQLLDRGIEHIFEEDVIKEFDLENPRVIYGDIASGDQFINDDEKRKELLRCLPGLGCVEMEGAAVAQVCFEYKMPFCVIRIISDTANHNANCDFGRFITFVSCTYIKAIINDLVR